MKYVLSTLTNPFIFVKYSKPVLSEKGSYIKDPQPLRRILIAGGANRPSSRGVGEYTVDNNGIPMWTPAGVVTAIDDNDLVWLLEDKGFKSFINAGHLKILDRDIGADAAKIRKETATMVQRDTQAPLLPNDKRLERKIDFQDANQAPADNAKPLTAEQLQSLLDA
jgi:hypothetical protein